MAPHRKARSSSQKNPKNLQPTKAAKVPWSCSACGNAIVEDEATIECYACKSWCHKLCTTLSDNEYGVLARGGDSVLWQCPTCIERGANEDTNAHATRTEAKLDVLLNLFQEMVTRMDFLGERLIKAELGENPQIRKRIQDVVKEEVKVALEEREEIEKRALNLLVVNIPESRKDTVEERKEQDARRVMEVIQMTGVSREELGEVENVFRLGREPGNNGRTRPLRFSIKRAETKTKILKNAREVNRNTQAGDTPIYINRDLTIKERETEKALRDELKEKRKGNGRWVIRNKKVVEVLEEGAAAAPRDT